MDLFEYILETMNYNLYTEDYLYEGIDVKKIGSDLVGYIKRFFKWIRTKFKQIVSKFKKTDYVADVDNRTKEVVDDLMRKQYETAKEKEEIIKNLNKVKKYDYAEIHKWVMNARDILIKQMTASIDVTDPDTLKESISKFDESINEICDKEFPKKEYADINTFKKESDGVIKDIEKVINDMSSITEKLAKKLEENGSDASIIQKYTNAQLRIFKKAMSTLN